MNIAIKPNRSVQIRILKELHPYLSVDDIVKNTGFSHTEVKGALMRRSKDKPKSRAPGSPGLVR